MKFFSKKCASDVMVQQLDEAEVLRAEHQAAAEHHQALADMYAQRMHRLHHEMNPEPAKVEQRAPVRTLYAMGPLQ